MAELAGNPMRCTTADAFPLTLFTKWCKIRVFQFQKFASGDTVKVTDLAGKTIWEIVGPADLEPIMSPSNLGSFNGAIVTVFTSATGELLVYFD